MLGAAWIAGRAVLPAIVASPTSRAVLVGSRDGDRARSLAAQFGCRAAEGYEAVLDDPEVEAVYIPLVNSLHREWAERALRAGKHVLCEKPLAMTVAEAESMAATADSAGRLLMEALMYRFHPRLGAQVEDLRSRRPSSVSAWFGFRLADAGNYRFRPELGGGALLDVGVYVLSACRWLLGEPEAVEAVAQLGPSGVDHTTGAAMRFAGGGSGYAWASIAAPETQALEVVTAAGTVRVESPFTAWRDPDDPYQLMVEAFAAAVRAGSPAPLPPAESIATLRLLERVRAAARISPTPAP